MPGVCPRSPLDCSRLWPWGLCRVPGVVSLSLLLTLASGRVLDGPQPFHACSSYSRRRGVRSVPGVCSRSRSGCSRHWRAPGALCLLSLEL